MDNKEAIKWLETIKYITAWEYPLEIQIAVDKAIQALNNEDIAVKDITTAFQFGMALGFVEKYDEMNKSNGSYHTSTEDRTLDNYI